MHFTRVLYPTEKGVLAKSSDTFMAKTRSSIRGNQKKKIVPVKPYKKSDGTKVSGHRRSTPN